MGEPILMYGVPTGRGGYEHLERFANMVLRDGYKRGRYFRISNIDPFIRRHLEKNGVSLKGGNEVTISDKVIMKYPNHPKNSKNAAPKSKDYRMVALAVKKPTHIYLDTNRNTLIYVLTHRYSKKRVIKIVIEPNYERKKKYTNAITSIGIVHKSSFTQKHSHYIKLK